MKKAQAVRRTERGRREPRLPNGEPVPPPGSDGTWRCPPLARQLNLLHRHVSDYYQAEAVKRSCVRAIPGRPDKIVIVDRLRYGRCIGRSSKALTGIYRALKAIVGPGVELDKLFGRALLNLDSAHDLLDAMDCRVGVFYVHSERVCRELRQASQRSDP